MVSLGGSGEFGDVRAGFTGAALMADVGDVPRPIIAEALPNSSWAEEDVEAKAVAATAIRANSASKRAGLFLKLIVLPNNERPEETAREGDCIRILELLR
jgi:hypothetical protein